MAKFVLEDQFGTVDVVVFSELFQKHARWLENGVPVLLTASVKDTGGVPAGRSAALAGAEQQAQQIHDEYGGHPEISYSAAISAYHAAPSISPSIQDDAESPDVSHYEVPDEDEEKSEAELERERVGADVDRYNLSLFSVLQPPPLASPSAPARLPGEEQWTEDNGGAGVRLDVSLRDTGQADELRGRLAGESDIEELAIVAEPADGATPAAVVFDVPGISAEHDSAVTPELNALDIIPLEGIRERKVKTIALELSYGAVDEVSIKKLREIFERYPGEVPVTVRLVDVPAAVAASVGGDEPFINVKLNRHFRIQPGQPFSSAVEEMKGALRYLF